MGAVIAVANQKGGVAKTTTVHSLCDALAEKGRRTLMVDLDPQACLTYATGVDPDQLAITIHDVMLERVKLDEVMMQLDGIWLIPSSIDLAGAELHLLTRTSREYVLSRALRPLAGDFDYVFIDCGPSLGILTINALTVATHVAVPFQCETLSHRGVGQLLETIDDVRAYTNEDLITLGGIATVYDGRTRLARQVLEDVPRIHGIEVLPPPIPKSVRVAEAPGQGVSVLDHAGKSKSADAYRSLAGTIEAKI